jgi:hypothetical protein
MPAPPPIPPDSHEQHRRGPQPGRHRSLSETGRILFERGLSDRPLAPWEVREIELRALHKIRTALTRR